MSREAKVIPLFGRRELTPETRAHLIQRVTDLAIEIALLESERKKLEQRLGR